MDINILTLSGRLTADPIVASGKTDWVRFSVAVNSAKKVDGQWINEADFFSCVAFSRSASALQSAAKGDKVVVVGRLKNNDYTDKAGNKQRSMQIIASTVYVVKSPPAGNKTSAYNQAVNVYDDSIDRDIPF